MIRLDRGNLEGWQGRTPASCGELPATVWAEADCGAETVLRGEIVRTSTAAAAHPRATVTAPPGHDAAGYRAPRRRELPDRNGSPSPGVAISQPQQPPGQPYQLIGIGGRLRACDYRVIAGPLRFEAELPPRRSRPADGTNTRRTPPRQAVGHDVATPHVFQLMHQRSIQVLGAPGLGVREETEWRDATCRRQSALATPRAAALRRAYECQSRATAYRRPPAHPPTADPTGAVSVSSTNSRSSESERASHQRTIP